MCIPLSRVPLVGSSIDEWLETTAHMKHAHDVHRKPKVLHASVDGAPPNTYSDPVYFWKASMNEQLTISLVLRPRPILLLVRKSGRGLVSFLT